MLKTRIIPCLDVADGRVVKGVNFVDLVDAGDPVGEVESVKTTSDVYAPAAGEIVEVNEAIVDEPESVNADPLGTGWFFKMKPSDPAQMDACMDEAAYKDFIS